MHMTIFKNISVYNCKVIILRYSRDNLGYYQDNKAWVSTELENITIIFYSVIIHNAPTGFDNTVNVS